MYNISGMYFQMGDHMLLSTLLKNTQKSIDQISESHTPTIVRSNVFLQWMFISA